MSRGVSIQPVSVRNVVLSSRVRFVHEEEEIAICTFQKVVAVLNGLK